MESVPEQQPSSAPVLWAFVAAVSGTICMASAWWLGRNELPNGFQNEYEHFYTLTEFFFRFRDNGWEDAQGPLWGGYYPPLNHVVASAAMFAFEPSREVAVLSQSVFLLVLLFSTAWIGRRAGGPWVAGLSVLLLGSFPAIFGNVRRYEPNSSLAALVAVAVAILIWRRGLSSRRFAAVFGLFFGLGMLCDRAVFAVYLLPVLVAVLWAQGRGSPRIALRERGIRLALTGLGAFAVSGYYYLHFLRGHIDEVLTQLGGEVTAAGDLSQSLPWWTPKGLFYYPLSWLDCQMGLLPGTFVLFGLFLYSWRGRSALEEGDRRLLEAWLVGGLLVITLVGKKQPFYSIPLLAPAAICAALGWGRLLSEELRWVVLVLIGAAGLHQGLFLTTHDGLIPAPGRWAQFAGQSPFPPGWLGYEYTQAAPPLEQGLGVDRMASLCSEERADTGRPYALLFSDAAASPENQVMPTLRLSLDTLLVEGVRMQPEAVDENTERAACFVYVTSTPDPWPSSASIAATADSFGGGPPSPSFLEHLDGLWQRSTLRARWRTRQGEHVHVYALASSLEGEPP